MFVTPGMHRFRRTPEKHHSRKRDDNLRLSAPRLGNGNASISAALALRRSAGLRHSKCAAQPCPCKRVRDARLCRSKTWEGVKHLRHCKECNDATIQNSLREIKTSAGT